MCIYEAEEQYAEWGEKKFEKGEKRDCGSFWNYMKGMKTGNNNMKRRYGSCICERFKPYSIVECCVYAHLHMWAV